ncbi:MAG: polysaccharide deacetylase family protein [Planctomycetes bacterium]|nr:polysaccharide deacetylase family protein [Planctomycetota bacterium]
MAPASGLDGAVALKIDVDTYQGMKNGVPGLLKALKDFDAKASFFLSWGPDRSGRAIFNIFRPGFLRKMFATNAPGLYGIRTMLYGTLLPSPMIASGLPGVVKAVAEAGHEIAVHAWDHRTYQDRLGAMTDADLSEWLDNAFAAHGDTLKKNAVAYGAPAWLADSRVLADHDRRGLLYASDCRGPGPAFRPVLDGTVYATPQIPSNMPAIEEHLTLGIGRDDLLPAITSGLSGGVNVLPVHAEVEGGPFEDVFRAFLERVRQDGRRFVTLEEAARSYAAADIPSAEVRLARYPGRSGVVLQRTA